MTVEKIADLIENKFLATSKSVIVTCKDHKMYIGFFYEFEDRNELRKEFKYRFVLKKNLIAFQEEFEKSGKLNPVHSIILDCSFIAEIEFL